MEGEKRKAVFEAGCVPPKKSCTAPSSTAEPQGMSAHDSLSNSMLQKQNVNLQRSLTTKRRELEETSTQLKDVQHRLQQRDEAVSVIDRHWSALEDQLSKLLSRLQAEPPSSTRGLEALFVKLAAPQPLSPGQLDPALAERCARTVKLYESTCAAVERTQREQQEYLSELRRGADPLASATKALERVEAEAQRKERVQQQMENDLARVSAELAVQRDRSAKLELARHDARSQLDRCQGELERANKELHRERQKRSTVLANGPNATTTPAAQSSSALSTVAAEATNAAHVPGSVAAETGSSDSAQERAELETLRTEKQAMCDLADERLRELKAAGVENARLKAALQEANARPATEQQLLANPRYREMQHLVSETRQATVSVERVREDLAQLHQARRADLAVYETKRRQKEEETTQMTSKLSQGLAQLQTERDSLALKLDQQALVHRSLEERAAESEKIRALWQGEAGRFKAESERARAQLLDREQERDTAIQEREHLRQLVHKHELQQQQLQELARSFEDRVPLDLRTLGQQRQEALVRLGSAEQAASKAKADLSSLRRENAALREEIDLVSKAFEESQEQNSSLLKTVQLKEEAATKLVAERRGAEQHLRLVQAEGQKLSEKAAAAERSAQRQAELRSSLEGELKISKDLHAKEEDKHRAMLQAIERYKTETQAAKMEGLQAVTTLKNVEKELVRSNKRETESAAAAETERTQAKQLAQERDALRRQVQRLSATGSSADAASGGAAASSETLEYYRSKINCTLCKAEEKNAMITKCGHTFCRGCIDQRLNLRNRKCPGCSLPFDKDSVKAMYLQA